MKEAIYKRDWVDGEEILEEHKEYDVRQVTCFVFSSDNKLLLVAKEADDWTITAGHYEEEKDKTFKDGVIREVLEESGLDISKYKEDIDIFGYALVTKIDKESEKVLDRFIQMRMFLKLEDLKAEDIELKPMEEFEIKYAQFCTIEEAFEKVKWLEQSDEWKAIKSTYFPLLHSAS
ncbi:MAG TPA: NUDIX domain-containing protein [Candidatus Dojkabacteria bacterium]|nr:NUDIX domain-containing protein [Candidatus Dojkabacteria bacterium]